MPKTKGSSKKLQRVERAKDKGKQEVSFNNQPKFPKKHYASSRKVSKMKKGY